MKHATPNVEYNKEDDINKHMLKIALKIAKGPTYTIKREHPDNMQYIYEKTQAAENVSKPQIAKNKFSYHEAYNYDSGASSKCFGFSIFASISETELAINLHRPEILYFAFIQISSGIEKQYKGILFFKKITMLSKVIRIMPMFNRLRVKLSSSYKKCVISSLFVKNNTRRVVIHEAMENCHRYISKNMTVLLSELQSHAKMYIDKAVQYDVHDTDKSFLDIINPAIMSHKIKS